MGDLHIEMAFMSVIGDWLEGSGWTDVYSLSGISTPGRIDSFLKSSHVKRTRYAHQVTLSVLLQLHRSALQCSEQSTYEEWKAKRMDDSVTALYWFTVTDLIVMLFMFVRSLRESNFRLYMQILSKMLPWFFALDHINYSRWLTVAVADLRSLQKESDFFKEFSRGKFTVNKTGRLFSSMGEDQAHEQHNKIIKDDGGAVGLFDNAHAVAEWAVAGPAISKLLETEDINRTRTHHEDTKQFESKFIKDCTALHQAFETWGNPFEEEEPGLVQYTTKLVMSEKEEKSVKEARYLGLKQYQEFDQNRKSLYNPIRKNKLPLFRQKNTVVASNKKQQAISMKERINLFSRFVHWLQG